MVLDEPDHQRRKETEMFKHPRIENATNNMGRLLVAAALLALPFAGACSRANATGRAAGTEKQTMKDIEELKRAEQTWADSLKTGDARRLATIIDAQFTFIGPDGELEKRDAYLAGYEALPKMGVVVERIDIDEVEYRVLGDVGIVTGHVLARVKMQGNAIVENVRFTRVYRRAPAGAGWQMVAGQGTRIAPGAPAKG
jgi:ketosteroid isomerase-like protein